MTGTPPYRWTAPGIGSATSWSASSAGAWGPTRFADALAYRGGVALAFG